MPWHSRVLLLSLFSLFGITSSVRADSAPERPERACTSCPPERPLCNNDICVQCVSDMDCAGGQKCDPISRACGGQDCSELGGCPQEPFLETGCSTTLSRATSWAWPVGATLFAFGLLLFARRTMRKRAPQ